MTHNEDGDELARARRTLLSPVLSVADYRPLSSSVRVDIGAGSRCGASRQLNDDHYLVLRLGRHQETLATSLAAADLPARFEEHAFAMLVADGLGEPGVGSVASRTALSTIAHLALHWGQWHMRIDPEAAAEIVDRAEFYYARADAAVAGRNTAGPRGIEAATALTVAYSAGDDLFIAQVGHSRAYLFRDGALIQLTRDQTVPPQAPAADRPPTVGGRAQDLRHILTDAIGGAGSAPTVEVEQYRLLDQDMVLICTNGLTDVLDDDRIADVLALRRQSDELCALLTEMAHQEGGEDNVTVVLAHYSVPAS